MTVIVDGTSGVTLPGTGSIVLNGSTSGTVTMVAPAVAGSPTLTLPSSVGTGAQTLTTDGTGVMSWGSNVALFGTGADGAVTISSGTTTLTRDVHYTNLTISGTGKLYTNGSTIYGTGTFDLTNAPAQAVYSAVGTGNNASGATGGGAASTNQGYSVPGFSQGVAGVNGTTAAGTAGAVNSRTYGLGGDGGAGGAGGAGTNAAGAASTTNTFVARYNNMPIPGGAKLLYLGSASNTAGAGTNWVLFAAQGGSSGGAGGGDGTNTGGGSGSGGPSGGSISIRFSVINRGGATAASAIQALGGPAGAGGNSSAGNTGGGAGGGGGGGGEIEIIVGSLAGTVATNALDVSGGVGGAGGNGFGTGKGGNGGNGGNGGIMKVLVLNPVSYTVNSANTAGTAGSTTVTATGAAGGAGATVRANL